MLMPVPIVRIAASLALLASSASGQVPVAPAEPQAQEIVVTGSRAKSLDRKKLARALKAHRSGRSIYAPQSQLFFTMRPTPGAPGLERLDQAANPGAREQDLHERDRYVAGGGRGGLVGRRTEPRRQAVEEAEEPAEMAVQWGRRLWLGLIRTNGHRERAFSWQRAAGRSSGGQRTRV